MYENIVKLARARLEAKREGKDGDEARIKELYLKFGGLFIEESEDVEEAPVVEVKPKARRTK